MKLLLSPLLIAQKRNASPPLKPEKRKTNNFDKISQKYINKITQ